MCWCSPIELAKEGRSKRRRRRSPGFTYTSSVYWYEGLLGCWNSKREPRGACKWKLNGQQPLAKEKAGAVQACFLSASFLSWAFLGASKFPAALATSPHHHHSTKGRLHTCSMITFQVVEYLAMQNIKVAKNHYKKSHLITFFVPKINFIQKWKLKNFEHRRIQMAQKCKWNIFMGFSNVVMMYYSYLSNWPLGARQCFCLINCDVCLLYSNNEESTSNID